MSKTIQFVFCVALAAILGVHMGTPSHAASVKAFYKGKTVIIFVVAAGGGYGTNAQMLIRHMGKHIPGKPTMIMKVKPGAGGKKLMNHLYNIAAKDGTELGFIHKDAAAFSRIRPTGIRFKAAKFNWIGRVAPMRTVMFVWHTAPAATIKEIMKTEVVMGATGKTHPTSIYPALMNKLVGTKFKIVRGFRGSSDVFLALQRGEVQGTTFTWDSVLSRQPKWISENKIIPLVHVSAKQDPSLKHVPLLASIMTNDEDRKLAEFLTSGSEVGRSFAAPPGVPADRVAALRKAFWATAKDPGYVADLKRVKLPVDPLPGDQLQKEIERISKASPELVKRAQNILGFK